MATKKLTLEDIEKEIASIEQAARNKVSWMNHVAQIKEVELHKLVLRSIANGKISDPKACAKKALESCRLKFHRYS